MSTYWSLETHGNPLGAVQSFINDVWKGSPLDGLLVHLNGGPTSTTRPRLVEDPKELRKVNPFKPLMTQNAARMIPELVKGQKDKRFGALLRPCEMRALTEMRKRGTFDTYNLLTICVDCLGTFPADEYEWRAERKKTSGSLAQETLQFARQGGILAYRYRSACQTCTSPQAQSADINICVSSSHVEP